MDFGNIDAARTAVLTSCIALGVSLLNLGWNIAKELWLRPRVRVTVGVMNFMDENGTQLGKKIMVYAVNFGPGVVYLTGITLKARWRDRIRGMARCAGVVTEPRSTSGNSALPEKLEIGAQARFWISYTETGFLKVNWGRVGITDSFDRNHWAPRSKARRARKQYLKDFPPKGRIGEPEA